MSAEINSNSANAEWLKFFSDAGVPWEARAAYVDIFVKNHIRNDILKELNKELLQDMGIKPIGDIIVILRHIRELSTEEALEKSAATSSSCGIANVAKVRPQANVSVTEHSQGPAPPAHGGVSGNPSGPSVGKVLQKVPRKNVHQSLIQRRQSAVTTGVDHVPRNNGLGVSKKGAVANVSVCKSTPTNKLKAANVGSSTSVKLRRPSTMSKTQNAATDTELIINSRAQEHVLEYSTPIKPRAKQDINAVSIQNPKVPAKRIISVSSNTGVSSKQKLVNKLGMKSDLVSTRASVNSAPEISKCKGAEQPKSILKKDVPSVQINRKKSGQLAANTAGPAIVRNFVLDTKTTDAGEELQIPKGSGSGTGATNVATTVSPPKSLAALKSPAKQRIVCMAVTLPVDEEDEEDDYAQVAEEQNELLGSGSDAGENSDTETSGGQVVQHCTGAGGGGVSPSSPGVQRKNIVSLHSVKYSNKSAMVPVQTARRVLPEYEGMYTIIMPKKTKLSKAEAIPTEHIEDNSRETAEDSDECEEEVENDIGLITAKQNEDLYYGDTVEELVDELYEVGENELDDTDSAFEVQPGNKTSVFDRLGWKNQTNKRTQPKSFRRYSSSLYHYMNHKPESVFSRLGFAMTRHVNARPYQAKNSCRIRRQQACRPAKGNLSAPQTHIIKKQVFQRNIGPMRVNQRTMNLKRTKMPGDSGIGNLSAIPARKTVRFGTKEELRYNVTPEDTLKSPRKPLPGSITLRTGIFDKLTT